MTPLEINRLCQWLIDYRDRIGDRRDRDRLADVCNALDGYAKLSRSVERATEMAGMIESAAPHVVIANADGRK